MDNILVSKAQLGIVWVVNVWVGIVWMGIVLELIIILTFVRYVCPSDTNIGKTGWYFTLQTHPNF